ncbi:hypothetical protein [Leptospira santarosai]|uniref:hypothetical protein n=1 Tax=Leptospira santarosai TaxID=28183 RepID=UPI0009595C35|nr:hypothetical protein [Leptospira santarosai]OLY63990.1 hypothetical protein BWD11_11075 [Leptospira santarosai serovar Grippotyphosa]ONF77492.1 hypothetical protein BWD12_15475 [Leptospira santarosai serovar Bananal]UZN08718.1 hypothetical protein M5D10_07240 [Leptospira santarosai]
MNDYSPSIFIYPIKKPITLLKSEGITLENLHDENEIKYFSKYLRKTISLPRRSANNLSVENFVERIKRFYAKKQIDFINEENPFRFLARTWLMCRFRYDKNNRSRMSITIHRQNGKVDGPKPVYDERDSYYLGFQKLMSFCSFFGFILQRKSGGKYPSSILLHDDPFYINDMKPIGFEIIELFIRHIHYQITSLPLEEGEWEFYPIVEKDIQPLAHKLNEFYSVYERKTRLSYILNQLHLCFNRDVDLRIRIVLLVGVIEVLLTRDSYQESLNKQFQRKLTVVLSQAKFQNAYSPFLIHLKEIYQIRSLIAHGDFQALDGFLRKRVTKRHKKHEHESVLFYVKAEQVLLENYLFYLFDMARELLREYIINPEYIDKLKNTKMRPRI